MQTLVDTGNNSADNPSLLYAFIYLNLIPNIIILPLLVGTFLFSTTATRHPVLVNVLITWILSGIFSCLLWVYFVTDCQSYILTSASSFFAGQHMGPEPNKDLCVIQTSLMYGITPMYVPAVTQFVYVISQIACW
jgi:hypothetical protein